MRKEGSLIKQISITITGVDTTKEGRESENEKGKGEKAMKGSHRRHGNERSKGVIRLTKINTKSKAKGKLVHGLRKRDEIGRWVLWEI